MATHHDSTPTDRPGHAPFVALAYLGGLAILGGSAATAALSSKRDRPSILGATARRIDEFFRVGFPIVGMVHVGFGSFLAMQAYYGASFKEANGAVVGLGLIRNVAPMVTGYLLAGMMAARITSEFRRGITPETDRAPREVLDREVALGRSSDARTATTPGRATLARVLAAMVAGPILTLWGAAVGTAVGALISQKLLGVPIGIYFGLMRELIQFRDALGLIFNGSAYCGAAALIACHEGLRAAGRPTEDDPTASAARAFLLSVLAILTINLAWFSLVYLAGSPTGPAIGG